MGLAFLEEGGIEADTHVGPAAAPGATLIEPVPPPGPGESRER
jgi:hypothetical protein